MVRALPVSCRPTRSLAQLTETTYSDQSAAVKALELIVLTMTLTSSDPSCVKRNSPEPSHQQGGYTSLPEVLTHGRLAEFPLPRFGVILERCRPRLGFLSAVLDISSSSCTATADYMRSNEKLTLS